ncbi:taurine ABC transporter permease TauC [Acinetobacter pollinis]|jgi:taurine transport system permease protein|uniref:Taurine ABC transporter permease TauC n=1 Tax=Acinetobacter pollinis TaxID=2605270 RepID=A0ABU6DU84_9GAMM|nr:taurine ABC transporter permease TauC [Acinetobacter pollinis]
MTSIISKKNTSFTESNAIKNKPELKKNEKWKMLAVSLLSVGLVLLIWFIITALQWVSPLFLPSPQAVFHKFIEVSQQGFMKATLWQHLASSMSRVLIALFAAIIVGVPIGLWMGLNKWARAVIDPLVELLRPIPPLAYLPLLVIWFGIGETTKILLIFFSILAPVIISSTHGVLSHQINRERAALSLGASKSQIFWHVILPTALPHIITGIRIGLGVGWSTLVAAELVAADRGIGFMVQSAAQFLITDTVILGIIVIAIVAVSFELYLRWLQKQLSPWYSKQL